MINKTNEMILKTNKVILDTMNKHMKLNIVDQAAKSQKHLRSPCTRMTSSVVDKIKRFEKVDTKKVHVKDNGLQGLLMNWKTTKPVISGLNGSRSQQVKPREFECTGTESSADETLNNFDEMLADITINLDQTTGTFDVILEDNNIFEEDCFDVTISDIAHTATDKFKSRRDL